MQKDIFLQQLAKLVSYQTLPQNHTEIASAMSYIKGLIKNEAKIELIENNKTQILLASNIKTNTPDYCYLVHLDVVSAPSMLFEMKITEDGNKVTGRGVSDMKYSIPIGIYLLNELIKDKSSKSFMLAITSDEEIGGFNGAKYLVDQKNIQPRILIVPDGGDNFVFVNKAKGVLQLKITTSGTSAHASRPWKGENAIVKLSKIINLIHNKYKKNDIKANWGTTVNVGKVYAGLSVNQVPDSATLEIDIRFPETTTKTQLLEEFSQLAKKIDVKSIVTEIISGEPTYTDAKNKEVKSFINCIQKYISQKILIKPNYGASDARHFASQKIPVLMMKPNGGDIHEESEWLDVNSTINYAKGILDYLRK